MKFHDQKMRLVTLAAICGLLLPAAGVAQSSSIESIAPTGDSAYPGFGQCSSTEVPVLPPEWSANVLLTPFQSQPLEVARVSAKTFAEQSVMLVVTDTVPTTQQVGWLVIDGNSYRLINGADGALQCTRVYNKDWMAMSQAFLSDASCTCMGSNIVAGVEADAWRCSNDNKDEYDWFWYNQGGDPKRFLFSRDNNHQRLPVLGDSSLNHFTDVVHEADAAIDSALQACVGEGGVLKELPVPTVDGIKHDLSTKPALPVWPESAFANGALFAVDGTYTNMAIYYHWPSRQEVSKILSSERDRELYPARPMLADTRLTAGKTYQVSYNEDLERVFPTAEEAAKGGVLGNVGIWRPDWARYDSCQYKATIEPGTPLNPYSDVPLQAMSCFFAQRLGGVESNIQAWYSFEGRPVMFYETNAGDLDLIDYYEWIPDAAIPEDVLYPIPEHVQRYEAAMMTECNACHGKLP